MGTRPRVSSRPRSRTDRSAGHIAGPWRRVGFRVPGRSRRSPHVPCPRCYSGYRSAEPLGDLLPRPDTNPLRSFRETNVRIFFSGLAVSGVGMWAHTTAVVLLVRELGGQGLELGIVTACQFLPLMLLGLYAGAVADRSDRRRLTIIVQALMGVEAVVLGVVDLADLETLTIVYLLALVSGTLNAFGNPARRTLSTELVPDSQLANVVSLGTSVITGSRIAGRRSPPWWPQDSGQRWSLSRPPPPTSRSSSQSPGWMPVGSIR